MPRGDQTGPAGMGPTTGRAAGYCAGYDEPGYMNGGFGRGRRVGRGWGMGMGFRGGRNVRPPHAGWYAPPQPAAAAPDEMTALKQQAEYLQETLKSINDRIEALEKNANNE